MRAPRLLRLPLLLAACGTAHAHGTVPHWVEEAHRAWGAAYNARDADALAAAHAADGVVVPPTGDRVVGAAEFVRAAAAGTGAETGLAGRAYLKPSDALHAAGRTTWARDVYHVVGLYVSGAANGTYYCRMAQAEGEGGWAMDALVFGAHGALAAAGGAPADEPAWLEETLAAVDAALRLKQYAGVARGFFAADAGVVARGGEALVRGGEAGIAAYLAAEAAGTGPVRVVAVRRRRDGQVDAIGEATSADGVGTRVFMTWAAVVDAWAGRYKVGAFVRLGAVAGADDTAGGAQAVPRWLAAREGRYGRQFEAADFDAMAAAHRAGGVVVAAGGDRFVAADGVAAYMARAQAAGAHLQLATTHAVRGGIGLLGSEAVYHTLGVNAADGSRYYMRWAAHHDYAPTWGVATYVQNVGRGVAGAAAAAWGGAGVVVASGTVASLAPSWLAKKLAAMGALYAGGEYAALAEMYAPWAVAVPAAEAGDEVAFVARADLAVYFASAAAGADAPALAVHAAEVYAEGDDVWHVIGAGARGRTYMRWVRLWDEWRVETHLLAIRGEPVPDAAY